MLSAALQVIRGFCMGVADLVPGVSGGTIALVFGIYRRLVRNVRTGAAALGGVIRADWGKARRSLAALEWGFLLPLLAGIGLAILILAGVISSLLDDYPVGMAAVFFGLVAASIVVAWGYIAEPDRRMLGMAAAVAVATFVLLGLRSGPATNPALVAYFLSGGVAITAMILPGISGSFILLMLGMYEAVLDAVHDRDLVVMAVFGAGVVIGLALFSTLLHWLLEHYHDLVMAALVGLMVGSLRVLWPWPDGTETDLAWPNSATDALGALALAGVAAVVVLAISAVARRRSGVNVGEV